MPSTTSRAVSIPLASSTVTTPSLPTLSMASAMRLPMAGALCAAIVATWAISFLSFVDFDIFWSSLTTCSTACSIPRWSPRGFAPAVTFLRPRRKMAWASTVAVVVPSPAMSEVLEATSLIIWAPMFSALSPSSISLATVTPSLVIVGLPNFLSSTTLRPLGPSVTLTARAMVLTPRRSAARASSLKTSCLGISMFLPHSVGSVISGRAAASRRENAEEVLLLHDEVLFAVQGDLAAGIPREEHAITRLDIERGLLAVLGDLAVANGDDLALLRLLLGAVGDDDAATDRLLLDALEQDTIMEWAEHGLPCRSHGVRTSLFRVWVSQASEHACNRTCRCARCTDHASRRLGPPATGPRSNTLAACRALTCELDKDRTAPHRGGPRWTNRSDPRRSRRGGRLPARRRRWDSSHGWGSACLLCFTAARGAG